MRYRTWYDPRYASWFFEIEGETTSIGDYHTTQEGAIALAEVAVAKSVEAATGKANQEAAEWVEYVPK
jgi:hypothetical protein